MVLETVVLVTVVSWCMLSMVYILAGGDEKDVYFGLVDTDDGW